MSTIIGGQRYREKHREQLRVSERQFYQDHKERIKKAAKTYQRKCREKVVNYYSGNDPKCARCGITDMDVLCIDHVNGNGNAHRRSIGITSGAMFFQWLIKNNFPDGFQVLCANCNLKKRIEGGIKICG